MHTFEAGSPSDTWVKTPVCERVPGYTHALSVSRLSAKKAARMALRAAKRLAMQIGVSTIAVSAVAEVSGGGPAKWLMDTGSGFDLVAEHEIPHDNKHLVTPARDPIRLHTANGHTLTDKCLCMSRDCAKLLHLSCWTPHRQS